MSDVPLNIAYYVTGHGLGHATRVVEVCRQLVASGHNVFVVTAAAAGVFTREIPSQQLSVRRAVLDCGSKQQDAFSVDMKGSLELYQETAVDCRDAILATEVNWLKTSEIDLVAVDIVPIAFAAAAAAGLPAVGVSNFSWGMTSVWVLFSPRYTLCCLVSIPDPHCTTCRLHLLRVRQYTRQCRQQLSQDGLADC